MNTTEIRRLYTPVQPAAKFSVDRVHYLELVPDPRLQTYIFCYWQFKTAQPLAEDFTHLIVADGCIDVFLELSNPQDSYVMGFSNRYTEFQLATSFHYIGIRFLPTMFSQLFKINAKELSDKFVPLNHVAPGLSQFIENTLHPDLTMTKIKERLDAYFLRLLAGVDFNNDGRLYRALELILQNPADVLIEEINTGLSPRQLRRLFEFYVGANAKSFCSVVRFQKFLNSQPASQGLKENSLVGDAGFYDQAHFIREFKKFYGATPGKALGR